MTAKEQECPWMSMKYLLDHITGKGLMLREESRPMWCTELRYSRLVLGGGRRGDECSKVFLNHRNYS